MTVLDTHAVIWWVTGDKKLSTKASRAIKSAASRRDLVISAASILEIATLARRGRLLLNTELSPWLQDLQSLPELRVEPVTGDIAARAGSYGSDVQGDPIDRLIIATATALEDTVVSADERMRSIEWLKTIW